MIIILDYDIMIIILDYEQVKLAVRIIKKFATFDSFYNKP